jgi:hypothetical protein
VVGGAVHPRAELGYDVVMAFLLLLAFALGAATCWAFFW